MFASFAATGLTDVVSSSTLWEHFNDFGVEDVVVSSDKLSAVVTLRDKSAEAVRVAVNGKNMSTILSCKIFVMPLPRKGGGHGGGGHGGKHH
jgi:hypothetical protein